MSHSVSTTMVMHIRTTASRLTPTPVARSSVARGCWAASVLRSATNSHTVTGFPDMYDTKYGGFFGMGHFDLMSGGSYNGDGFQPAEYTAYERMIAGWTIPTELVNDTVITSMEAVNKQGETFIIYNKAYPDEYYLIENRQKTGFDEALPSSGLMITHVDYDEWAWFFNIVNSNCDYTNYSTIYPEDADYYDHYKNDHERCTIFHADNSTSYEDELGDLYPYAGTDSLDKQVAAGSNAV